jgi:hypothetical protein
MRGSVRQNQNLGRSGNSARLLFSALHDFDGGLRGGRARVTNNQYQHECGNSKGVTHGCVSP